MRVFVAGAGGFIGRRICDLISEAGHDPVRHVWEVSGDLAPGSVPDDVDVLVNAAGKLGSPSAGVEELRRSNLTPVEILAEESGARRIPLVHISTPGVAGLVPSSTEDMPLAPWGPYEETKAEAERLLYSAVPAAMLTVLRPDFVYGPGDRHKLAFFRQVARGWFPLVGREGARIRPTFVDDVARAVLSSLPGGPLHGGLYNIGGPGPVTVRKFACMAAEAMGTGLRLLPVPPAVLRAALLLGPLCPGSLSASRLALFGTDHFVDVSKASKAGFSAETRPGDGLRTTVAWYRDQGLLP